MYGTRWIRYWPLKIIRGELLRTSQVKGSNLMMSGLGPTATHNETNIEI